MAALKIAAAAFALMVAVRRRRRSSTPGAHLEVWIGVDLGATTVSVGSVSSAGNLLQSASEDISERTFPAVCALIAKLIRSVVDRTSPLVGPHVCVTGVGIGSPGILDLDQGIVLRAANFAWVDAPLADTISALTGYAVVIENDGNAALLAEQWVGAGRGARNVVMLTLGSGIGGAAICNGELLRGSGGMAMEIGHMVMQRGGRLSEGTGVRGVFEEYGSARAVGRIANELIAAEDKTAAETLSSLRSEKRVTCKEVFEHAKDDDALAKRIVDEAADTLGLLCINVCRVLDPEIIVISGGMTNAGEALFSRVRTAYHRYFWSVQPEPTCHILPAESGNAAGVIGAAAAAMLARLSKP